MVGTLFAGARVDEAVPLAPLTTLRVGPVAPRVITCTSTEQVVATLRQLDGEGCQPLLVLAGGSNVVIAETLTDLTVVRLATDKISVDGNIVRAEAGAVWDDVVVAAVAAGMGGLECLSGIPGSAGATPVQNVGAYGAEVADTITRVRLLDRRSGAVRWAPPSELGFGYRTSVLKHSDAAIVLEVEFALDASGRSAPLRYAELVAALGATAGEQRGSRDRPGCCAEFARPQGHGARRRRPRHLERGLVFHQSGCRAGVLPASWLTSVGRAVPHYPAPDGVKLAAGWLVEQAGFGKGYPDVPTARCRLSTKHALALTNRGEASRRRRDCAGAHRARRSP